MARHQVVSVEPETAGPAKVDILRPDGVHIVVEGDAAFVAKEVGAIFALLAPPPPAPPTSIVDWRAQEFCVTCDHWYHPDCLAAHAEVRATADGEWKHTDDEETNDGQ